MTMPWHSRFVGIEFDDDNIIGWHCWGLVVAVYADQLDIVLPSYGEVTATDLLKAARQIATGQAVTENWCDVAEPQVYDVVLMRLPTSSIVAHVGVMVDSRHVLHIEERIHSAVVPLKHFSIRNRIAGYRRYVGPDRVLP